MRRPWPTTRARLFARLSCWSADRRGLAAIEFALILPMLLILYLGGYQVTQAISAYRKLSDTTVEIANITAQYQTMSAVDMSTVMNATSQIMAPFSTQSLQVVVSEIGTDANNKATVQWSVGYQGGTALTKGATVTLPTGMSSKSTCYILAQTKFTWTSVISFGSFQSVPMSDQIYMIPRQSAQILYTG
jgi:Flp pilus assembly protein TadG